MMIKNGDIASRLYDRLAGEGDLLVEEVRIGLGYAGVRIEGDERRMGLAAVLRDELGPGCSLLAEAGQLAGSSASSLLRRLVEGKTPLEKALGLAAANALLAPELRAPDQCVPDLRASDLSFPPAAGEEKDSIELINLAPYDRVAMIGLFAPLVRKIEGSGAELSIIERDASLMNLPDQKSRERILKECTVAIITATSLLNDTLEEVLNGLGDPRHVLILGPSTPLCAEVFQGAGTPVTHLGGAAVLDAGKAMQIISEGGGTRQLRPFLRFINMAVK